MLCVSAQSKEHGRRLGRRESLIEAQECGCFVYYIEELEDCFILYPNTENLIALKAKLFVSRLQGVWLLA